MTADLSQPDAAEWVIASALDAFGDLDVLVNNAGVVRDRMSFNLTDEDWDVALAVNLSAPFHLSRAAVRHWRAADARRDRTIVNTTSESGLFGNAGQANYAAAKAGVAALTLSLAAELDRRAIRVNAIAPRARTPMSTEAFGDAPRGGAYDAFAPEHVAAVVAWLASDASRDVTGQVLTVHGSAVEVMQPWTAVRRVPRSGPWTDEALTGLRDELFPGGQTKQLARPVAQLFIQQGEAVR